MSSGNGTATPRERPSSPRAVDPLREGSTHHESGLNSASENHCTMQSVRAERAYRDWNAVPGSSRPLNVAHDSVHKMFDELLHAHWMRGEEAYTNELLGRSCGIDEKGIRQWRDGAKRLPLAALMVLPPTIAVEIIQWISERRGLGRQQRAVTRLADSVAQLEKPVAADDRDEVLRGLIDAQRRIADRIAALATGVK